MLSAARLDWSLSRVVARVSIWRASTDPGPSRRAATACRSVPASGSAVRARKKLALVEGIRRTCRWRLARTSAPSGNPGEALEQPDDPHLGQLLLLGPAGEQDLHLVVGLDREVVGQLGAEEDPVRVAAQGVHRARRRVVDEVGVGERRHPSEGGRVDRRHVGRVLVELALHHGVERAVHHRGGELEAGDVERLRIARGMLGRARGTRRHPHVGPEDEAGVGRLGPVVRRGERGDAGPEGEDQPDDDHPAGGRPRAPADAPGQQTLERPAEAGRRRCRQVREAALDRPRQEQHAADPDTDRDDHQVQLERHRPSVVDGAGDALEGAGPHRDRFDDDHHQQRRDIEPQPPPGGRARRELGALLADVPVDGATAGRVQGRPGGEEPADGAQQGRGGQVAGRGAPERIRGEDGDGRGHPEAEAEHRAGAAQGKRAQGVHPHQVAAVGAADAQDRLLAPEGAGQDAAGVRGQERAEQGAGQAEEHEHALGRAGVVAGHLEGVGDVVHQGVLAGRDLGDGPGDRPGLGQGGARVGVEPVAFDGDVHLEDRPALDDVASGRLRLLEGGHDRLGEHLGLDHHGVVEVDELLELLALPAVEEGPGPRQVGDPADADRQGLVPARDVDLDDVAGPGRQRPGRLGAEQPVAWLVGPADDPDGGVVLAVPVVEAEQAHRTGHLPGAGTERAGGQVDEGELVGRGHAGDVGDPARQLGQARRTGRVGRTRRDDLAAGEGCLEAKGRDRLHRRGSGRAVADRHPPPGGTVPRLSPNLASPWARGLSPPLSGTRAPSTVVDPGT